MPVSADRTREDAARHRLDRNPPTLSAYSEDSEVQWAGRRADPVRFAWTVILVSFACFCLLAVLITAVSVFTYRNATIRGELLLQSTIGTVYLHNGGRADAVAVTSPVTEINRGSRLVTQREATQGVLGLFRSRATGGMLNSVQISSDTILDILKVERPLFPGNGTDHLVDLVLTKGQIRVVTLMPEGQSIRMQVKTPHGSVELHEGVFRLSVGSRQTEVVAINGEVAGHSRNGVAFRLGEGQRLNFEHNRISEPVPDIGSEILTDGRFEVPVDENWSRAVVASDIPPPTMERVQEDGRWVIRFHRAVGDNAHNQFELRQAVDRNVSLHESLYLRLTVRIDYQSLSGAGVLSSEFPVRVEIGYTDIYGQERAWGHGFYYREPIAGYWIENGEQIPQSTWFAYESPDLFNLLALNPPETITYVRIHASGHDYTSYIGDVSLTAH